MAGYGKPGVSSLMAKVRNSVQLSKNFGLSDNSGNAEGLLDFIDETRLASGINPIRLVNGGAHATWDESDNGTFDKADVASAVTGAGVKLTATSAGNGTQTISTDDIDGGSQPPVSRPEGEVGQMNWEESDFVGFWAKPDTAGDFATAGDLKFNIKNNGDWGTAVNVPALAGTLTNWERLEIDITSFQRDRVEAIRFELNSGPSAGEDISIDEVIRYKFGNGYGPVMGKCEPFPIVSGSTVARQEIATINDEGLVSTAAAASGQNLGPVVVGGTGGSDYDVAWIQTGGRSFWPLGTTVLQDQTLVWGASHKLMADAGTSTQDVRVLARMPGGTTVTENKVVLVEWGYFIQDGGQLD